MIPIGGRPLWIHAASVGETAAAVALIEQIRADRGDIPVVLSVNTPAARSIAAARLKGGTVCYFPLDFPWVVRRALDRIDPRAVVFMEAEIWPAFVREAALRKIPLLLVNGRMSEKTYRRFRYIGGFIRRVLGRFSLVTAQSAEYRERYTTLGCDPARVLVTGNIKYDIGPGKENVADDLKRFISARKRPVLIAGSTHGGEEEIVLDAFARLAGRFPDLLLILAPRHLARTGDVERLLKDRTIGYVKRSRLPADGRRPLKRCCCWIPSASWRDCWHSGTRSLSAAASLPVSAAITSWRRPRWASPPSSALSWATFRRYPGA